MPSAQVPPSHATLKLAAIGTLAGIFSGLFGVGGGTVIVPLLIFWFGYGERLATGTSLAAIVLIGLLGTVAQGGIYGNVHVGTGLLLAILICLFGGLTGGLVGVGGGVLFVPALTIFIGLTQVEAESTSLLMIVLVAIVGAYRQNGYGNVRL